MSDKVIAGFEASANRDANMASAFRTHFLVIWDHFSFYHESLGRGKQDSILWVEG